MLNNTKMSTSIGAFLLILLVPAIAFASGGTSVWIQASATLVPAIVSLVLVPLMGWGTKKLIDYLNRKIENQLIGKSLTMLTHAVSGVTSKLSQTMAEEYKKAAADGKLTDEEKEHLKTVAFSEIKSILMAGSTWTDLISVFGTESQVDTVVKNEIEKSVRLSKDVMKLNLPQATTVINSVAKDDTVEELKKA